MHFQAPGNHLSVYFQKKNSQKDFLSEEEIQNEWEMDDNNVTVLNTTFFYITIRQGSLQARHKTKEIHDINVEEPSGVEKAFSLLVFGQIFRPQREAREERAEASLTSLYNNKAGKSDQIISPTRKDFEKRIMKKCKKL